MRIAVVSDHSDQRFCSIVEKNLRALSDRHAVYRSEFEDIALEVLDPDSGLKRFEPDLVYLNLSTPALRDRYYCLAVAGRRQFSRMVLDDLNAWVEVLRGLEIQVVVNLLPPPIERFFGSFSSLTSVSPPFQWRLLNEGVINELGSRDGVLVNDLAFLASSIGLRQWSDERFWCHSKYPCRPSYLKPYAESFLAIINAFLGQGLVKCVVTDLDNTLWGGVIGDDGLDGILVGGVGEGEAHARFQQYLRALKDRGIILCVCSKNTESIARSPFQQHGGMVLQETDFAAFVANWSPKSDNIKAIAKELNLGLSSFAFVDDSPFERAEVREALPEVIVPELPEDPAGYAAVLDGLIGLESTVPPSEEDSRRTEMYQTERKRVALEGQSRTREGFLEGLGMKARFEPVGEAELQRAAQLVQRSNQFNLRTQRYDLDKIRALSMSDQGFAYFCTLEDRFGDHGIISVVCGEMSHEGALSIGEWVMSCRVLGRGVEQFIRNGLLALAKKLGASSLTGEYLPTGKNALVENLYPTLGFVSNDESVTDFFSLPVDSTSPLETYIAPLGDLLT